MHQQNLKALDQVLECSAPAPKRRRLNCKQTACIDLAALKGSGTFTSTRDPQNQLAIISGKASRPSTCALPAESVDDGNLDVPQYPIPA